VWGKRIRVPLGFEPALVGGVDRCRTTSTFGFTITFHIVAWLLMLTAMMIALLLAGYFIA
jgi:hypothetical protein